MANPTEKWEYGELMFFEGTSDDGRTTNTRYIAATADPHVDSQVGISRYEVMNTFGARGWRLTLIGEETLEPGQSTAKDKLLAGVSAAPETTMMARYAMARLVG